MEGETSLPGLYAGGICCMFPGSTEVLSGVTLSICNVFGYRAGQRAGQLAKELAGSPVNRGQVAKLKEKIMAASKGDRGLRPIDVYTRIDRKLVRPEYSIFKGEERVNEMLDEVRSAREEDLPRVYAEDPHELVKANEARNFLDILAPIFLAALERKESRLAHYRTEYPYRDDIEWLRWVVIKKEDDTISLRTEAVPAAPEKRLKLPAAVKPPGFES